MMEENGLPKGWVETTLGEVVEKMYSGGTPSTNRDDYYNGNIPWIRTQEVTFNRINDTDLKITELGLKNSSAKYIPINTVIVAMYGNSAGRVALSKIEATTNQACCNIVTNPSISSAEYIFYNLLNRYEEIKGKANGAAQQNLNVGILRNLEIILPPLPEQKAIASILISFDDKIELLQAQNETLETIAQTIFKEWFGKYQVGDELPEGWRVGKLEDFLEIKYGKDHKHLKDGKFPLYGSGGIMRYVEKPLYDKESILIPRKGTLSNLFYLNKPFWSVDTMFYSHIKKLFQGRYVFQFLNSLNLSTMDVGSAVPSLTTQVLNQIPMVVPHDEIIIEFDNIISSFY